MISSYMNYCEKLVNDSFKFHKATIKPNGDILWREPNTNMYLIGYFVKGKRLFVIGDCGDAIYSVDEKWDLESWSETDLTYFANKCNASEKGKGYQSWDGFHAEENLKTFIAKNKHIKINKTEAVSHMSNKLEWNIWLSNNKYLFSCNEDIHFLSSIGKVINISCLYHLRGLQMAIKQLNNKVEVKT